MVRPGRRLPALAAPALLVAVLAVLVSGVLLAVGSSARWAHAASAAQAATAVHDASAAPAAELARQVRELRTAESAARLAAQRAEAQLGVVLAAQVRAEQRQARLVAAERQQRIASTLRLRGLLGAGGNLGLVGAVLTGGRPADLLDRAQVAAVVAAGDATDRARIRAASAREAAVSAQLAALADAQLTITAEAGRRAGALHAALQRTAAALAALPAAAPPASTTGADADRRVAAGAVRSARDAAQVAGRVVDRAGTSARTHLPVGTVPTAYRRDVERAGRRCPTLSPALLAAQLAAESGWHPGAVSRAGAQGLAQFLPSTWARYGRDADGDGSADPFDPGDAIAAAADYDCALAVMLGRLTGSAERVVDLMLAGYNAGPGAVLAAGGVPPIAETQRYVARVRAWEPRYRGTGR